MLRQKRVPAVPVFSHVFICLVVFIFVQVSACFAQDTAKKQKGIRIVSPPSQVWVTEKQVFLAGIIADKTVSTIHLTGVKSDSKKGMLAVDKTTFGTLLTLKKGMNTVTLKAGDLKTSLDIFYSPSEGKKKGEIPPKDFTQFFVHKNQSALNCKECHRVKRGKYNFKRVLPVQANCTTGGCHTDMGKQAHVHGPVGAGVCISCHNPHGSNQEKQMQRSGGELCLVCHQAKKEEFSQDVVHAPVEEGCVDCHDPHESAMRFQLKGDGGAVSSLCFQCHESEMFTKEHRHGPVGSGDCIACHQPHASKNPSLLIAPQEKSELCFRCHQDRKEDFSMKHVHPPVVEDCGQCHDPHSSPARFQLHQAGAELCVTCHEDLSPDVYSDMNQAKYKHLPVDEGRCTACHRPHSSEYQPLLAGSLEKLCFTCHDELSDEVQSSHFKHGPVQTGDCTACHKPHGSGHSMLLVRDFPADFYNSYEPGDYDLCFGCHNKDIAKNKFTDTLTNFRDGNYNLHFFHVNMKKGRTCTACHAPHASDQPKHVRYEVPFGAWSYPIDITKTETGGTCVVGCHAPKTYDRKKPQVKPSR